MKYVAPALGFIALCLMAFGSGNVLRQKMYPEEYLGKNEFLETVGRYIKGALRGYDYSYADAKDRRLVNYGSRVYTAQCASCHGVKLQGQPDWKVRKSDGVLPAPPHDATGHTWHHSDDLLFGYTNRSISFIKHSKFLVVSKSILFFTLTLNCHCKCFVYLI